MGGISLRRHTIAIIDRRCHQANDPKAQKYQELFQRDKEMSELIDSFDEKKARTRI